MFERRQHTNTGINAILDLIWKSRDDLNENSKLLIDWDTECELMKLTATEVGEIAGEIFLDGPRGTFDSLYGIPVEWDADELKMDHGLQVVNGGKKE